MINSDTPDVVNLEGKVGINVEQVVSPAVAGITTIAGAPNTAQTVYIGGNDGSEYGGNTGIKTVYIASTEQKNVVSIANYQTDGSVDIGGAMLDGTINIGRYVGLAGATGNNRNINIGSTSTGADGGTINIGCGYGYSIGPQPYHPTVNISTGTSAAVNIGTGEETAIVIGGSTGLSNSVLIQSPTTVTITAPNGVVVNGSIVLNQAANKINRTSVATTTAALANTMGSVALIGGTITITTSSVTANSLIKIWRQSIGATGAAALGQLTIGTINAGVSFVINSVQAANATALQASDVSVVGWEITN